MDSNTRKPIYADSFNGMKHNDLKIDNYDVERALPEEMFELLTKGISVPIRVKILSIINESKDELNVHRKEKIYVKKHAEELKKNLTNAIIYMKKVEKFYERNYTDDNDELLNTLRVITGNREIRNEAIASYELILENTKKILVKGMRVDAYDKKIKHKCVKNISDILKKRGVRKHRIEAISLIIGNGIEIPNGY